MEKDNLRSCCGDVLVDFDVDVTLYRSCLSICFGSVGEEFVAVTVEADSFVCLGW